MKKLKKVGFYKELEHCEDDGPSLKTDIGKLSGELPIEKLVAYLKSGEIFIYSPTLISNVLEEDEIIGGLNIFTDGVWAWRSDLVFYLEKYKLGLPDEFIEHIIANNWQVDSVDFESVILE